MIFQANQGDFENSSNDLPIFIFSCAENNIPEKIIDVNLEVEKILQYSKEEILNFSSYNIILPNLSRIILSHNFSSQTAEFHLISEVIPKDQKSRLMDFRFHATIIEDKPICICFLKNPENTFTLQEILQKRTHDLNERIKELNCLYGISRIREKFNTTLEEIMQEIVDFIPIGWQYPEITCSRVIIPEGEFKSKNYKTSKWCQKSEIIVFKQSVGFLEIGYLEEKDMSDEGPFLKEERNLINGIAERLGKVIERKIQDRARKEAEENIIVHAKKLEASLKEKELLLKEIQHRVKNNLQLIFSLVLLQEENAKDENLRLLFQDFKNRIEAMSRIHESLYQVDDITKIDFAKYIENIVSNLVRSYSMSASRIHLKLNITQIDLSFSNTIICGLIINELVSNVLKYAFPNDMKGILTIRSKKGKNGKINLDVIDNGIGLPVGFDINNTDTLGLQIVAALSKQLKGTLNIDSSKGTKVLISFSE